jgi:hypothetical protein
MHISTLRTHVPSLTIQGRALARGLLTVIVLLTIACATHAPPPPPPPPPTTYGDPASACKNVDGKYLGDLKCQYADGSIATILSGEDASFARITAIPVTPKSPRAWALATTAIIFEVNKQRHDLLSGVVVTPEDRKNEQQTLSKWWNVHNRDELLETLRWLQFEGHRAAFDSLGRQVDAMSEAQFLAARAELLPAAGEKLDHVRKSYRALGEKGILAWDLVRYIALCRWGYAAGYLPVMDAWNRIMPAALRLQKTFSSWQDMQNDYLIGRDFWSTEQTQENGARFRAAYERLIQDPNGPWNVNPWTMDLGVAKPLPIARSDEIKVPPWER